MKIALDVDGVLADFHGYVCEQMGIDPDLLKTWHFEDSVGPVLSRRMYNLMGRAETWLNLPVKPLARWGVWKLMSAGVDFAFVTSVPERFAYQRAIWLHNQLGADLDKNRLVVVPDGASKPAIVVSDGYTHIIDDKPTTVNETADYGVVSILEPSPYMNERPLDPRVKIQRFPDFVKEITR